jgi:hypothetical protein
LFLKDLNPKILVFNGLACHVWVEARVGIATLAGNSRQDTFFKDTFFKEPSTSRRNELACAKRHAIDHHYAIQLRGQG